MSQPWADLGRARRAVNDPATSSADLAAIAQQHPELRARVAWHNAAYPGLLEWLAKYGGPGVAAAVISRQNADQAMLTQTLSFPAAYGSADVRDAVASNPSQSRWRAPVAQRFAKAGLPSRETEPDPKTPVDGLKASAEPVPSQGPAQASGPQAGSQSAAPPVPAAAFDVKAAADDTEKTDAGIAADTGLRDKPSDATGIQSRTFPSAASALVSGKPPVPAGEVTEESKAPVVAPASTPPAVGERPAALSGSSATAVAQSTDTAQPTPVPPAPTQAPPTPARPPSSLPEVLAPAPPDPLPNELIPPASASQTVGQTSKPAPSASLAAPAPASSAAKSTADLFASLGAVADTTKEPAGPKISRLTVVAVVATLVIALVAVVIGVLLLVLPPPETKTNGLAPMQVTQGAAIAGWEAAALAQGRSLVD